MNPFKGINPVLMDRLLTWPDMWSCDFRSFYLAALYNALHAALNHSKYAIRHATSLSLKKTNPYDEDINYQRTALTIIHADMTETNAARPIVWFELLAPPSLPGGHSLQYGEHWTKYRAARNTLLEQGSILIELHYIPCGLPVTQGIPVYPHEPNSKAYHATVSAAPTAEHPRGRFWLYSWGVDEVMPTIPLPLVGEDGLCVDLQIAYQRPLSFLKYHLNYNELPRLWECYREDDQDRIAARLMTYLTYLDNNTLLADTGQPPTLIADYNVPGIGHHLEGFLRKRSRECLAR